MTPYPILPATGEKVLDEEDHAGQGADALSLVRSYRSSRTVGAQTGAATAGLGQNWSHNHASQLELTGTAGMADSAARILFGDGSVRAFSWDANSSAYKPSNSADLLTVNATGLLYQSLDDDSHWQFDAAGRLQTVTQRNGWVTSYSYTTGSSSGGAPAASLLTQVANQFGRTLNFTYNAANQLASVVTPDQRVIRYGYDGTAATARLTTVVYPASTGTVTRTYLYENTTFPQLVTGIVDETGSRLATYAYDSEGRAITSQHAGGVDLYSVSYPASAGLPTTVTDPLGTQRTYNYGTALGKLTVTGADKPSATGGSVAASRMQDANGFVTQETDFLGVNTTYTWDTDRRLPLTVTTAAGLPEAQTVTTQWHATHRLPVLVTEPGRSTAYTYDALGNMLTSTVTDTASNASRTTTWAYNAAGQVLSMEDPRGKVTGYAYHATTVYDPPADGTGDPDFTKVTLLLKGNGSNGSTVIRDDSPYQMPITVVGDAKVSSSQSVFGGTSIAFDGVGDYLSVPYSPQNSMAQSDFTIETFLYKNANNPNFSRIWSTNGDFYDAVNLGLDANGNFAVHLSTSGTAWNFARPVVANLSSGQWHHLAVVRSGGSVFAFVNGTKYTVTNGLGVNTSLFSHPSATRVIGGQAGINRALNGYIDEFRITKGKARYTQNFTPPTQAFPDPNAVGHTVGDLASVTNAAGHVTQFTQYDAAGRVRQMVDPKGVVTGIAYTPRGWVSEIVVTPPGGSARTTSYGYDAAGQLTGVTQPDGSTLSYSYDAAQRLVGVTDAKGNSVSYTLDNMGNRVSEEVKDPGGVLRRTIGRSFDALNRLQQVTGSVQ